jgi:hypothetical protein
MHPKQYLLLLSLLALISCSQQDNKAKKTKTTYQKGRYIGRHHDENLFTLPPPVAKERKAYPWDKVQAGNYPKITKEFFRCHGSQLNPYRVIEDRDGKKHWYDCGGVQKHSLPLRDGKEFVYPILLDLLNYVQTKTGKRVIITCGHRCPEHNTYCDNSVENQSSKHMIGAEVSFYVQDLEKRPDLIIALIQQYYQETPVYSGQKDYTTFLRYEKSDSYVSTPPWYNKEVYVKLFRPTEGRNFDNRHPYPYISIQVRYDRDLNERVNYSWDKAHRNYLRW